MSSELTVVRADFDDERLHRFLQEHLDDLAPESPAESRHALDLTGLRSPTVRMWVALEGDALVGTAALADLGAGHAELKSMRTAPARRGSGIATRLVRHVLADARSRGIGRVSLETGSGPFFAAARRLYAREGFVECEPFAAYVPDPYSTFMTSTLAGNPGLDRIGTGVRL